MSTSQLDPAQIIQSVYDEEGNSLRTNVSSVTIDGSVSIDSLPPLATGTNAIGSVEVTNFPDIQNVDVINTSIPVTQSGAWNVSIIPSGAATLSAQTTGNDNSFSIDGKIPSGLTVTSSRLLVDSSDTVQPISGTVTANQGGTWNINNISGSISLPTNAATESTLQTLNSKVIIADTNHVLITSSVLPSGASTLTAQTTGNNSLFSIDTKLSSQATETTLSSLNSKVTTVNTGAVTISTALPTGTNSIGQFTANAGTNLNTSALNLETTQSAINIKLNSLGQKISASSMPVTIASDQSAFPITQSGTWTSTVTQSTGTNLHTVVDASALPSGASTESTLSSLNGKFNSLGQKVSASSAPIVIASDQSAIPSSQSGTWNINNVSGTVSLPIGAATESTLSSLNSKVTIVNTGAVTISSSVLPSGASTEVTLAALNTKINTLGQKTSANSTPVVIASDQSAIPATQSGSWTSGRTWTLNNATDSINAVQSGTWNINNIAGTITLPSGASSATNQTSGGQKTQIVDGSGNIQPSGDVLTRKIFTQPTDGTNNQGYTVSNEAKVLVTPLTNSSVVKSQLQDNAGTAITVGQKLSTSSLPVVISSDQTAISSSQFGTWNIGTVATITNPIAVTQSGIWTIQPGNTANTTPWLVTDSSDGPVTPGTVAVKSSLIGGQFNTALPTLTNGQQSAIQLDSSGRQIVILPNDLVTTGTINALNGTVTADGALQPYTSFIIEIFGTFSATTQIGFEQSTDATNYYTAYGILVNTVSASPNNSYFGGSRLIIRGLISGIRYLRARALTFQAGDNVSIKIILSCSEGPSIIEVALPAGPNVIGGVTQSGTWTNRIQDSSGNTLNSDNGQLFTQDVINVSGQNRAQSVTTSAAEALGAATILVNRKFISITPTNGTVYWGFTNGVTTSTGTPIQSGISAILAFSDNVHVYVIATGTVDTRIAEGS